MIQQKPIRVWLRILDEIVGRKWGYSDERKEVLGATKPEEPARGYNQQRAAEWRDGMILNSGETRPLDPAVPEATCQ